MREGAIAPGYVAGISQPGGAPTTQPFQPEPSRYQADRPLPTEIDQGGLSPVDRQLVLNPLTVTLYKGGEVVLGSPAPSFLPNAGTPRPWPKPTKARNSTSCWVCKPATTSPPTASPSSSPTFRYAETTHHTRPRGAQAPATSTKVSENVGALP